MGHSASVNVNSRKRVERADRRIEEAELAKKQLQELQENAEKIKGSFRRCNYNGEGSSSTSSMDSHVAEYRRLIKTRSLNRLATHREGIVAHHGTMVKRRSVQDVYGLNS